jgi:cobalt-zinc-cadmium efflux system protein
VSQIRTRVRLDDGRGRRLTFAFVTAEAVAGYFGHSLALMSDAGHNLADVAALANALSLVAIALWIAWEAIARLREPQAVDSRLMIGVALAAIVVNLIISMRLHAGSKSDINVRSAYTHMLGDAVAAFGVLLAGLIVAATRSTLADPIVSVLIAAFILWSSWGVLRESATILLEGTPPGTDMPSVIATIKAAPGVLDVHELHVWMIGPGVVACSCHLVVAEQSIREGQQVVRDVVRRIERDFHITHTTAQVEVEGCEPIRQQPRQ